MRAALVFLFLLSASPLFAYLDPGTGSLLLYALLGIATTVLFALRSLWYSAKGRAVLSRRVHTSSSLPDILFHSEGGHYWQVFQPVIEALRGQGISCAYVTPDAADPALSLGGEGFKAINPGKEAMTIAYMNAASAALVISTTPHLDVYMLKRSRRVKHYAHLFHAPTDVAFYEKYAFDYYDSLFTVGAFQERSIRQLEERRGLPRKELYKTGCTYFEYMLQEMKGRPATGRQEGLTVLYATGWGPRSSVPEYGTTIVERLSREGIRVIFRPHPHSYVSEPRIMRDMEERISRSPLAELDRNRTGIGSMERADIMIADLSGVLFDWAFLYGKPVILANSEADLGGQEGEDLSGEVWDIETSKRLAAHCLSDQDLLRIPEIVERSSRESHQHADTNRDERDREIYNFGSAGPAAAENIRNILRGVV